MKKRLNKIPTNYSVELTEQEVVNLSETLSAVRTAGGGTGGVYIGDGQYIGVDNTNNRISFLPDAATKLESVSDKLDKSQYATDSATFLTKSDADDEYAPKSVTATVNTLTAASSTWNNVTAKLDKSTYAADSATFLTAHQSLSGYYQKTETSSKEALSAEFEKYQTIAGMDDYATDMELSDGLANLELRIDNKKQDKLTFGYDATTSAITAINNSALAGQGGTTYSAGQYINIDANDTISVTGVLALDEYAQYEPVLVGDANITATSSKVDSHTQWNLAINSTPVVTDTTLKGDNCVTAHTTTVSGEWAVGLVQSAYEALDDIAGISTDVGTLKTASSNWNKVSDKLDSTAAADTYLTKADAATTYQPTGNYLVADDITGKLDKSIYAGASGNWEASYNVLTAYSAAGQWLTAHQSLTNYYTKSDTSSKTELSTEFAKYVTSSDVSTSDTDYVMTTTGWKVLTLPGGGMTQVIHDTTLTGQGNANDSKLGVAWSALSGNTIASALSAGWAVSAKGANSEYKIGTWLDGLSEFRTDIITWSNEITGTSGIEVSLNESDYPVDFHLTQTAYNSITSVSSKVDKPTSLVDKYLVLRTDSNGAVSGWCDFQDQSYSKTEAQGTFVATANIDTTTLSGDGKSVSTKLGVKTDVIATKDYVNSSFLPLSGGTVSGKTTISGSSFDNTLEIIRGGQTNNFGQIGLNNSRGLSFKAIDNTNSTNLQLDLFPNNTNSAVIQVQHNGSAVGNLIPAVTSTTTAGLTDDGILHIILES